MSSLSLSSSRQISCFENVPNFRRQISCLPFPSRCLAVSACQSDEAKWAHSTAHRFSTLHTAVHCKTLQCTATGQHSFSTLPMLLTAKKYFNSAQVQPTIQLVLQNTIVSSPPILHNNVQHTALLVYKSQDLK